MSVEEKQESLAVEQAEGEQKNSALKEAIEWVKMFVLVFLVGILLTTFVIQRNTVSGLSMFPTLHDKDELFVEKVTRYFGYIHRGDIITVTTKGLDPLDPNRVIKRVVGMPGEHIEILDGSVYIDGEQLPEPYLPEGTFTRLYAGRSLDLTLDDHSYFVMGDNRDGSKDSRHFGPVPAQNILGKVLVRFYPFDRIGQP